MFLTTRRDGPVNMYDVCSTENINGLVMCCVQVGRPLGIIKRIKTDLSRSSKIWYDIC